MAQARAQPAGTLASLEARTAFAPRPRPGLFRKLARNRGALAGAVILITIAVVGVTAPLLAPHDPNLQTLSKRLAPPFQDRSYPLGAEQLGRDIVSRLMYGS